MEMQKAISKVRSVVELCDGVITPLADYFENEIREGRLSKRVDCDNLVADVLEALLARDVVAVALRKALARQTYPLLSVEE